MFNYISGTVEELGPNLAVIDCGGVGFQINTSAYTVAGLKTGEKAKLYTYVYIREDIFEIYGFSTRSEKRCFELLLGVSGVGPKAAASILSVTSPENLIMAIVSEDVKTIMAAQGVGKKIAQRVILELKDKLAKDTAELSFAGGGAFVPAPAAQGGNRGDAVAALTVLGYSSAEINAALKDLDTQGMSTEEIIKAVLRQMAK